MKRTLLLTGLIAGLMLTACQNDAADTDTTTTTTQHSETVETVESPAAGSATPVEMQTKTVKNPNAKTPAAKVAAAKTAPAKQPAAKADPLMVKGLTAMQNNQLEAAIKAFSDYLKLHPKDVQALNNRGVAYIRLDKKDLALKDFDQMLALMPNMASLYYNRATLLASMNRDMLPDLNKAIALDPAYLAARYDRANLYFSQKNYTKAKLDLDQILKYAPKNPESYNFRGFISLQQGQYPAAIKDFDAAIKLNPKFGLALANKAQTYYKQGKCPEALSLLKQACQVGHQNACALLKTVKCNK